MRDMRAYRILSSYLLGWTYEDVFLHNPQPHTIAGFQQLWQRYLKGEPLARIIGQQTFCDRPFTINPDVLEPRVDSELIIRVLDDLDISHSCTCLDLGVGSGCLLITLLLRWPTAKGVGVDISQGSLHVAMANARRHGVSSRSVWIESDWWQRVPQQTFDVIVSNPPYVAEGEYLPDNVRLYDPHVALYGGATGLEAYRAIGENIALYCHHATYVVVEVGHQYDALRELWGQHQMRVHSVHTDDGGNPRVMVFCRKN